MKLYQLPYSPYSAKVRIVLLEKNLESELPPLPRMGCDDAEYLKINPTGLVPCLVDDGFALGESEVIAEYLEETYPDPSMMPVGIRDRAMSRWLSRIHDLYIAPQLTLLFCRVRDGENAGPEAIEDVDRLFQLLDMIESAITPAPFFFGEKFCLSDASHALSYWYALVLSQQCGKDLPESRYPRMTDWYDAISTRESFRAVLGDCKTALGVNSDERKNAA